MDKDIKDLILRFTSRKFLLTAFVLIIVLLNNRIGIDPADVTKIVLTVIGYLTIEGTSDVIRANRE